MIQLPGELGHTLLLPVLGSLSPGVLPSRAGGTWRGISAAQMAKEWLTGPSLAVACLGEWLHPFDLSLLVAFQPFGVQTLNTRWRQTATETQSALETPALSPLPRTEAPGHPPRPRTSVSGSQAPTAGDLPCQTGSRAKDLNATLGGVN